MKSAAAKCQKKKIRHDKRKLFKPVSCLRDKTFFTLPLLCKPFKGKNRKNKYANFDPDT